MPTYGINPYISFVESRLIPGMVQHAVFHRLTGELIEPHESLRSLLLAARSGTPVTINEADLQLRQLAQMEFLIPEGHDPLALLVDQYVTRPIQNPAIAYRSKTGEWILVRTSMMHAVFSRRLGGLGLGLAIRYNTREFSRCINWQHWGPGEYVTALEPVNGTVQGRAKDREQGLLDEIAAGGRKTYRYRIEAIADRDGLDALRALNR